MADGRDGERTGAPWDRVQPLDGAVVMATGIVSTGCLLVGFEVLSAALFAVGAAVWVAVAAVMLVRFVRQRRRWLDEARKVGALTGVAGTGVLGVRCAFAGFQTAAWVLLAFSAVLWVVLLPAAVRHTARRVPGAAYLTCVATQSLAVLATTLWLTQRGPTWPLWLALGAFVLGLALYVQVLVHFDFSEVRNGKGDHWVACGALAISALASARLTGATAPGGAWAGWPHAWLRFVTLVLLAAVFAWYAVLVVAEIRWSRPQYDTRRWATVFPLGMTAVATLTTAPLFAPDALTEAGRLLLLVAVVVWFLTAAGATRAAFRTPAG
ncbi:tellurite resistance/C4-dicarboxylate transporter family protein [Streptomyces sulphureus]|uniref:tellurite resistance/C4-dicarboxylate transporter family protein n=1 Tax=Streptomyces sulphureus TaxID=47758 RepID=UPI000366E744|nr:tellurite resistance/C4-dicarboxylate transporter family protein [Streptomyces sulphureus]